MIFGDNTRMEERFIGSWKMLNDLASTRNEKNNNNDNTKLEGMISGL